MDTFSSDDLIQAIGSGQMENINWKREKFFSTEKISLEKSTDFYAFSSNFKSAEAIDSLN